MSHRILFACGTQGNLNRPSRPLECLTNRKFHFQDGLEHTLSHLDIQTLGFTVHPQAQKLEP